MAPADVEPRGTLADHATQVVGMRPELRDLLLGGRDLLGQLAPAGLGRREPFGGVGCESAGLVEPLLCELEGSAARDAGVGIGLRHRPSCDREHERGRERQGDRRAGERPIGVRRHRVLVSRCPDTPSECRPSAPRA